MKKGLVLFPCDDMTRRRLQDAAGDRCVFVFREKDWYAERYHAELREANIIIGEPRIIMSRVDVFLWELPCAA